QDEQPGRVGTPRQVFEQEKRWPFGPADVVEHQEDGVTTGDGREPAVDRFEQPVPVGVRVTPHRLPPTHFLAEHWQERGELPNALAEITPQRRPRRDTGVMAERLTDRLVRPQRLFVPPAVEDEPAALLDS